MKAFVVFALVLATATFSSAEDDGQYHPEKYGGDGKYRPLTQRFIYPGRYYNPYDLYRSPLYRSAYQPVVYNSYQPYQPYQFSPYSYTPYQSLLAPLVTYGDGNSIDQEPLPFASSVAAVTIRPPVAIPVTTARAVTYASTPVAFATPAAVTYSSTPKAIIDNYRLPFYAKQYLNEGNAKTIQQDSDSTPDAYHYSYKTENGIAAEEAGKVDLVNGGGTKASGFYEYIGVNGLKYRVDYTADENGFHPSGAHLP